MPRSQRRSAAENTLKTLLQAMDDAVVLRSADGMISLWNRAAAELFHYSAPEVIGTDGEFLIPEAESRPWRDLEKWMRGDGKIRRTATVRLARGKARVSVLLTMAIVDPRRPATSDILEIYQELSGVLNETPVLNP